MEAGFRWAQAPDGPRSPALCCLMSYVLLSLFLLWPAPSVCLEQQGWRIDPAVSPVFVWSVLVAYDTLPPASARILREGRWRIELVVSLCDAVPDLADEAPRGWPPGWSWKNVDAVHLPAEQRLVFAEWRISRRGGWVRCDRVGGVVRHELAHAWDRAGGSRRPLSDSPEFRAAYRMDLQQLASSDWSELRYFVQSSAAGRQETFAELAALAWGGGSSPHLERQLRARFPRSLALVRKSWHPAPSLTAVRTVVPSAPDGPASPLSSAMDDP